MQVDDLLKISLLIGVMSSKVIPDQYVVSPGEAQCVNDRLNEIHSAKAAVHPELSAAGTLKSTPQRGEDPLSETQSDDTHLRSE